MTSKLPTMLGNMRTKPRYTLLRMVPVAALALSLGGCVYPVPPPPAAYAPPPSGGYAYAPDAAYAPYYYPYYGYSPYYYRTGLLPAGLWLGRLLLWRRSPALPLSCRGH